MNLEINQKYKKLAAKPKRTVNKLIHALSRGTESDSGVIKCVNKAITKSSNKNGEMPQGGARKISPYLHFYKHNYHKQKKTHPELTVPQIGSILGAKWREMNDQEKSKWAKKL